MIMNKLGKKGKIKFKKHTHTKSYNNYICTHYVVIK